MPSYKTTGNVVYTDPLGGQLAGLAGVRGMETPAGFSVLGALDPLSETSTANARQTTGLPHGGATSPTLFDWESMQKIVDFLQNPQQIGEPGLFARSPEGPLGLSELERMYQQYVEGSTATQDTLMEGLATGFKTDIGSIRDAAMYQLMNETVPSITESFAGTSGLASSDFGQALARAGAGMETELGALEAQYQESANARRAQIAEAMPALSSAMLFGPSAWGAGLAETEAEMRQQEEAASPGGRLYQSFLELMGQDPGAYTYITTTAKPSGMEKFGQVMQGISSLFG